jgi:5-hydroxyisourate hydrolase-like protein (transthyretin family)
MGLGVGLCGRTVRVKAGCRRAVVSGLSYNPLMRVQPFLWVLASVSTAAAADLAGRVLEDHTGNPLASVVVRVVKPGMKTLAAELETASDGRFTAGKLPDGEYRLELSKPNFIGSTVRLTSLSQTLELRLVRAGVITGLVLDAKGQPVRGASVYALPKPAAGGPLRIGPNERGVRLNERGQYRLHSLPPGEYAVAVTYGASTAMFGSSGGADVRPELGSGAVLYPESARPRFFAVAGGEEYRNIDFSIVPAAMHSVSGKIELPDPKASFWLALIPSDGTALAFAVAKTKPDGSFRFEGIASGIYTITASGPVQGYGGKGITTDKPFYGRASVSVANDQENVVVPLVKGAEASLILRMAGPAGGCRPTAQVSVNSLEDFAVQIDRTATIDSTKEISVANLAPARYEVVAQNLGEGCYQASETILDLSRGAPQGPATVYLAQAGSLRGKLAGTAKDAAYVIALTPADAIHGAEALQAVFADAEGRFTFGSLRPGRYRIGIQLSAGGSKARWLNTAARMIEIEIAAGAPTEIELPAPARQE